MTALLPTASHGFDWIKRYQTLWQEHITQLKASFHQDILNLSLPEDAPTDVPIIEISPSVNRAVLEFCKSTLAYNFLSDITASDETPRTPRFDIIYQLFSHTSFARLRIKISVEDTALSVISQFAGANWAEREIFDMFGVTFTDHPNLRRILMHDAWQGHPLRKDYPLKGYQAFTYAAAPREQDLESHDA